MTGVSTLAQALSQITRINKQQVQMDSLSTQLATGKITQKYTGLKTQVMTSERSRAAFGSLEVYKENITNASRRIELMRGAVKEFQDQARNILNVMTGLLQEGTHQQGEVLTYDDPLTPEIETTQVGHDSADVDVDLGALIQYADTLYDTMTTLLNVKDGDRYLLSGSETLTTPVTDTGALEAAISSLITDWKQGTITTDQLITNLNARDASVNPRAITDSLIGYSTELSNGTVGDIFARVDDTVEIKYTALANAEPFRDILVGIAYIKNGSLPPIADAYLAPNTATPPFSPDVLGAPGADLEEMKDNFYRVMNGMIAQMDTALNNIDLISYNLGTAQTRITEIKTDHNAQQHLLQNIISDVEDIDQNEVALKLSTILAQIEASFTVTARMQQLSLVNFMSPY